MTAVIVRYPDNHGHDHNPRGFWLPFLHQVRDDLKTLKYPLENPQSDLLDSYRNLIYGASNNVHETLMKAATLPRNKTQHLIYNLNLSLEWVYTIFTYHQPPNTSPKPLPFDADWADNYHKLVDDLTQALTPGNHFGNQRQKALTIKPIMLGGGMHNTLLIPSDKHHIALENSMPSAAALANHLTLLTNGIGYAIENTPDNIYNSFWRYDTKKWASFKKTYAQLANLVAKTAQRG